MGITNVAIIGKIPGYGSTLDEKNTFGKILLRDVTYIDMIPAFYSINMDMLSSTGSNFSNFYKYTSGDKKSSVYRIFKNIIQDLAKHVKKQFVGGLGAYNTDNVTKAFLISTATEIIKSWQNTTSIRILGANDSTFTETISNNFTDNNSQGGINSLASAAGGKITSLTGGLLGNESLMSKFQNMSYSSALDALTTASTGNGLISLLTGKVLGVQFATPNVWQSSAYNSSLNLFIKLAAPSGDPLSVLKYITLPILSLMAAGSPITLNGVTYGMPLIWDVRAYGITHFKIGAMAAMTISRGSYETVFNSAKQPLLVDVRITIVPLMQHFAVQYNGDSTMNSKIVSSMVAGIKKHLPSTSTTSSGAPKAKKPKDKCSSSKSGLSNILNNVFNEFECLFANIVKNTQTSISGKGNGNGSIYGGNGLGVQSPGDEIDGLMGISYTGPNGIPSRDGLMELSDYSSAGTYVKGFANSYTFKI